MAEMPPLEEFSHLTEAQSATRFAESQNHIVYRTLIADTQTAVGAMMKLADGQDYHCLLDINSWIHASSFEAWVVFR